MKWNTHFDLTGKHAFLGASKWRWINYDEDHLTEMYQRWSATQRGTILHDFAAQCISLG